MLMLIRVFFVMMQMNTVLEKLSSSARELAYYHSGEGTLLFCTLCGSKFCNLRCLCFSSWENFMKAASEFVGVLLGI